MTNLKNTLTIKEIEYYYNIYLDSVITLAKACEVKKAIPFTDEFPRGMEKKIKTNDVDPYLSDKSYKLLYDNIKLNGMYWILFYHKGSINEGRHRTLSIKKHGSEQDIFPCINSNTRQLDKAVTLKYVEEGIIKEYTSDDYFKLLDKMIRTSLYLRQYMYNYKEIKGSVLCNDYNTLVEEIK